MKNCSIHFSVSNSHMVWKYDLTIRVRTWYFMLMWWRVPSYLKRKADVLRTYNWAPKEYLSLYPAIACKLQDEGRLRRRLAKLKI